jgi:3-hydroxy-3-methylglutaryl CoA synthase/uncharacterized OB-fold protein
MTSNMPIAGYASYVPMYRLARAGIQEAIQPGSSAAERGYRSIAGSDEDTTTMAVAAVRALRGSVADGVSWLYLSSSNFDVLDLTSATIVATAARMPADVRTMDMSGLRSGATGLLAAAATGGVAVASDLRVAPPGSSAELGGGDAAAAFYFANTDDPVAEIAASVTYALPIADHWREVGGRYSHTWEERFLIDVYSTALEQALKVLLPNSTDVPTTTIVASPVQRVARSFARRSAGGSSLQVEHAGHVGYCGAAELSTLLAEALDRAHAGDTILALSAVGGVDAMLVRALRDGPLADPRAPRCSTPVVEVPYVRYLAWRGLIDREGGRRPERSATSLTAASRSQDWKFALTGSRCERCGFVQLPSERMCAGCGAVDASVAHSVADRVGTVVSVSTDALSESPVDAPLAGVVDFDGGGRMSVEFTDAEPADIAAGSRVSMAFRRTSTIKGLPDYFWRARAVRRDVP